MPDREALGRRVREVWVEWASEQPDPKPSHLVGWGDLDEGNREVDMRIGEALTADARVKLADRGRQIAELNEALARKNRQLDALHMVWCSGGCRSGVHRWTDEIITGELVAEAERNTKRLRSWYDSVKWRLEHYKAGMSTELHPGFTFHASQWHEDYALRNAAKTDLLPAEGSEGA